MFERIICEDDYETDGGQIPTPHWIAAFWLHIGGGLTRAAFKSMFSMTTAQGNELDELLDSRPAVPLLLLNVPAWSAWPHRIAGAVQLVFTNNGIDTASDLRAACGL